MKKNRIYFFLGIILVLFLSSCSGHKTNNKKSYQTHSKEYSRSKDKSIIAFYAKETGLAQREIQKSIELYRFIDEWLGVPYQWGGNSKKGVDCSGFTHLLYKNVYRRDIPRTTKTIHQKMAKKSYKNLKEGDVVFFNYEGKTASHVGVYLGNHKFVHASTSKGVMISDISQKWYKSKYHSGGVVK